MAAPAPEDNKQEGEAYFDSQAAAAVPTKDIEESSQTGLELKITSKITDRNVIQLGIQLPDTINFNKERSTGSPTP